MLKAEHVIYIQLVIGRALPGTISQVGETIISGLPGLGNSAR
jgi:hypothetical protein